MLVDEARIFVSSGRGGDGVVAFRREKYVSKGGPAGGDGGRGGDVVLRVNKMMNTLISFTKKQHFVAKDGGKGGSSNKTGANADILYVDVPPGTIVRDEETGIVLADLVNENDEILVARGGRGGKGNKHFASASNRTPRVAEKGAPAEERWLLLELKLIADVGVVGVPNAGKSTLLSVVSNAKPKIADYPFTTIAPNLGVVVFDHQDLVFADIPGLIEGAHMGVGLGHKFLQHVQRTQILVHLLDGAADDPIADFNQINAELSLYDERLSEKPQIVVMNKMDLPEVAARWEVVRSDLEERGITPIGISALARDNIDSVIQRVFQEYAELPQSDASYRLEETIPIYDLEDDAPVFEISRDDDGSFLVTGKRIERAAAMTYWDHEEAVLRFQKILEVLGVSEALQKAGVVPGDTVFIGDFELEWTD